MLERKCGIMKFSVFIIVYLECFDDKKRNICLSRSSNIMMLTKKKHLV